jgi:hypothetical protein
MRKYLIDRDRFLYGWNAEMAKNTELYEIDLDETSAEDFQFPDSDNNEAPVRVYSTGIGNTPEEADAEAQRKALSGEPFITRHESTITLVKDPDALLDMKPLTSPTSLTQASELEPDSRLDEVGKLKAEFRPHPTQLPAEDPRPAENAALLRAKGVSDRDQRERGEDEDDALAARRRKAEETIAANRAKKEAAQRKSDEANDRGKE